MTRDFVLNILILIFAFFLGGFVGNLMVSPAPTYSDQHISQCSSEDPSTDELPCIWDATRQGNGTGESFLATATTTVHFTTTDKD